MMRSACVGVARQIALWYDTKIMRVLVLSDIHANLVALETVLNAAQGKFDESGA